MAYLLDPGPDGANHDNWNTDPREDKGDDVVPPWGIR